MALRTDSIVVLLAITSSFFAGCENATIPSEIQNAPKSIATRYTVLEILESGDFTGDVVTAKYAVDSPLEEPILRQTCQFLVAKFIAARPRRYVKIEFYLHESDQNLPFRGGWAEWGVNGEYAASLTGILGDYSRHRFRIEPGVIFQANDIVSRLTTKARRSIYWEITATQDEYGMAGRDIVAQKRGLTDAEVIKVSAEGVLKSWPIPPDPELRMNDEEFKAHHRKVTEFTNQYFENKRMREADSSINNKDASKSGHQFPSKLESNPVTAITNQTTSPSIEEEEEAANLTRMFDELKRTLDGRLNDEQRSKLKKMSREYAGFREADLADQELVADGKVALALQYANKQFKQKASDLMKTVVDKYPDTSAATTAKEWIELNP